MKRRTLEERQREMRERILEEQKETTAEVLKRLKSTPLKSDDEFWDAMKLLQKIHDSLDPSSLFTLQLQLVTKHYNLNRKPDDEEMTAVNALLTALKKRKP